MNSTDLVDQWAKDCEDEDNVTGEVWSRKRLGATKEQLNAWLWTVLPPAMPLGLAENVAVEIIGRIEAAWNEYGGRPPAGGTAG